MKKIFFLMTLAMVLGFTVASYAQKIVLKSGTLDFLHDMTEIRIEYAYDNMMVGKLKEADYVSKKVKEYNSKEPGKGDTWQEAWVSDRELMFQPRFQEAFNNFVALGLVNFKGDINSGSKAKMVFHTTFTEPGYNIYMSSKNASINAEVKFYDESGAEMALVTIMNSPGSGFWELDYDTGTRIQEAYANAGRSLAVFILEKVYGK